MTRTFEDMINTQDELAEKRAQIDEEISLLRQRITALLTTRNAFIPVAALPPEILTKIFAFSQINSDEDGDGDEAVIDGSILLNLTWVCRQWRSIALEDPLLWTHINHTNHGWAAECLNRSQRASLTVNTSDRRSWPNGFFEALLPEMQRIQQLTVSSYTDHAANPKTWGQVMPRLSTLKLSDYNIPDDFTSLQFPALHTLDLEDCHITELKVFPSFSSLTRLTIESADGLTMRFLLEGLSSTTNLAYFELFGSAHRDGWNDFEHDLPHISLQNLTTLVIDNTFLLPTIEFIRHLSVPSDARCTAKCIALRGDIFPDLSNFRWRNIHGLQSIIAGWPSRRRLTLGYWGEKGPECVSSGGCLSLEITFRPDIPSVLHALKTLPMNDLGAVLIHGDEGYSALAWRDIFAFSPNLKSVGGVSHAASAFMEIFLSTNMALSHPVDPVTSWPFPALTALTLKNQFLSRSNFQSFCEVLKM